MPLNILPAPAALPGAAPPVPAADAPPGGGLPVTGSAALLFGLLLAQTVGQAAPKAPPAAAQPALPAEAAPAAKGSSNVAETLPALTVAGNGENRKKDKDKTPAEAQPTQSVSWQQPAPLTIPALSPPKPPRAQAADTTKTTQIAISGKVMDTVPAPGGELLSPQHNNAPTEVDLVPTETGATDLPHVPVPTATPLQAVTAPPLGAMASEPKPLPVAEPAPPSASALPATSDSSVPPALVSSETPVIPPAALPAPSFVTAAMVALSTVAAAVATPPAPKNNPLGTPQAQRLPTSLQNTVLTADNQPVKNAGSKSGSLPAPAAGETARVAVKTAVGGQAPAAGAVTKEQPVKDRLVPSVGHDAHTAEAGTPAPSPQAAPASSQSQTATPMPPADRTRMLAQVTHGLEAMMPKVGASAGRQQVTLQLHPQDWGHLNVRVTMTPLVGADGKVTTQVIAHVIAEHPAVKAALETGQTELRHALREAGLHLDRLTVTVQAPAAGSETSAGGSRPESRSGEGWGAGQTAPFGTTAQGGSNPGGSHPTPSAAFAQGQTNRAAAQADATEAEDLVAVTMTTTTGRVDTRA